MCIWNKLANIVDHTQQSLNTSFVSGALLANYGPDLVGISLSAVPCENMTVKLHYFLLDMAPGLLQQLSPTYTKC